MKEANRSEKEPVLIVGATSAIARALADRLAGEGHPLVLAARDEQELRISAADITIRHGVAATAVVFDALDETTHERTVDALAAAGSGSVGVVVCHGELGDQEKALSDWHLARRILDVNYVSAVSLLNRATRLVESRGAGFFCVITSVAADRGRQSNFLYGSAKAGLSTYLSGLRNRLFRLGVPVLDVKPGFVDTAMTFGLPKLFLVASPDKVAGDIHRALRRRRDAIYTPWFWRWILRIIRAIPEPVFKRLKL